MIGAALRAGSHRFGVTLARFSIQGNHIHLLVETSDRIALGRAMKGLGVRIARGLNAMMSKRGRVLADRYHAHVLATPSEVRRAIAYIRDNARQHAARRGDIYSRTSVDPYSSDAPRLGFSLPDATTWLVREGWRRAAGP